MSVELEFWPEYGGGPLWFGGESVDLGSLRLSSDLAARLIRWNDDYADDRLPSASNDAVWLAEGRSLLGEARIELAGTHAILVREPWWGEDPED